MAPTSGTFRSSSGRDSGTTAELGAIVARGGERAVTAPWALGPAEIIEWLVEDGDPVSEGQPLVRVQPAAGASAPDDAGGNGGTSSPGDRERA